MAYQTYRFSLRSEETRGAAQPNIIRILLNSDADAAIFADNLASMFDAEVETIDTVILEDYALPYPTGTNVEARFVMRDNDNHVQTERLYSLQSPFDVEGFASAIVAASTYIVLPRGAGFGGPVVSVQPAVFIPSQSI